MSFKINTTSTNENRGMYQWLRKNFPKKSAVITEGYLQFISILTATQQIIFNVLQDGSVQAVNGENRLKRSDSFWATEHGFSIAKVTDPFTNVGSAVKQLFPNINIFANAAENLALRALYFTGKLKIQIGSTLYYDNFDINRFENVTFASQGIDFTTLGAASIVPRSPFDRDMGMAPLVPHVFFNGAFSNELSINLAESVNMASPAGATNIAIYTARGFYITNGALTDGELRTMMASQA